MRKCDARHILPFGIFVAVVIGIGAAIFVAHDYYRLSAVDGSVVIAFMVTMLALNFIFRKAASWCLG